MSAIESGERMAELAETRELKARKLMIFLSTFLLVRRPEQLCSLPEFWPTESDCN